MLHAGVGNEGDVDGGVGIAGEKNGLAAEIAFAAAEQEDFARKGVPAH